MKWMLTVLVLFLVLNDLFAQQDQCAAILRGGVFDTSDVMDLHYRHKTVSNITCSANSTINFSDGTLSSSDFCKKSFEQFIAVDRYVSSVRRASQVIAGAWLECVKLKKRGLSHYFTTTPDPRKFQYTIVYDSEGEPYVSKIKSWNISSTIKCTGPPIANKTVDSAGITLDCTRRPVDQVDVTVNATSGKADPITLPAVKDAYALFMASPDDVAWCWVTPEGKPAKQVLTSSWGAGDKAIYLNNYFSNEKSFDVKCKIGDNIPGSHGGYCWGGRFRLIKNGVDMFDWHPSCCTPGCPGGFEQFIKIERTDLVPPAPAIKLQ